MICDVLFDVNLRQFSRQSTKNTNIPVEVQDLRRYGITEFNCLLGATRRFADDNRPFL